MENGPGIKRGQLPERKNLQRTLFISQYLNSRFLCPSGKDHPVEAVI
ncbi:MAG: hypothetical protein V4592_21590 [Bacteroidota bacterium]